RHCGKTVSQVATPHEAGIAKYRHERIGPGHEVHIVDTRPDSTAWSPRGDEAIGEAEWFKCAYPRCQTPVSGRYQFCPKHARSGVKETVDALLAGARTFADVLGEAAATHVGMRSQGVGKGMLKRYACAAHARRLGEAPHYLHSRPLKPGEARGPCFLCQQEGLDEWDPHTLQHVANVVGTPLRLP